MYLRLFVVVKMEDPLRVYKERRGRDEGTDVKRIREVLKRLFCQRIN